MTAKSFSFCSKGNDLTISSTISSLSEYSGHPVAITEGINAKTQGYESWKQLNGNVSYNILSLIYKNQTQKERTLGQRNYEEYQRKSSTLLPLLPPFLIKGRFTTHMPLLLYVEENYVWKYYYIEFFHSTNRHIQTFLPTLAKNQIKNPTHYCKLWFSLLSEQFSD